MFFSEVLAYERLNLLPIPSFNSRKEKRQTAKTWHFIANLYR